MKKFLLGPAIAAAVVLASSAAVAGDDYELLAFDGHLVKWGEAAVASGATVTYALANAPMRFPKARNCKALEPVDAMLADSGIPVAAFRQELRAAIDAWERVADVHFVAAESPETADIVIGAQAEPRGIAFANVMFDTSSKEKVWLLDRAQVCLNPTRPWKIGFGGDPEVYDLRYTLTHELGHTLGLDHPGPSGQMMSFQYHEAFRTPQSGDVAGVVALYGPSRPALMMAGAPAEAPAARAPQAEVRQGGNALR